MKILIWWHWDKASEIWDSWRDGHRRAFEELAKYHEVIWHLGTDPIPTNIDFQFLLFWDDSNSEVFNHIDKYDCRKGICLTTDPTNMNNLRRLDVVFVESDPIYNAVRAEGIRCIKAFGTDTDFFHPNPDIKKDLEYFYPATFSDNWKCQKDIAYLGNKLTCIGTLQPDGVEGLEACKKAGVNIEIGYFPVEKIRDYYWRTQKMIIPAWHGSERTVLEAMACNILPEVTNPHNVRTKSYIEEYKAWGKGTPRDFILEKYSHILFCNQLRRGIE